MRFSEFYPKERAQGRRDADGNNQSHSRSYQKSPLRYRKLRAKQGSTQIRKDVGTYTGVCAFKINLVFLCSLFNYIIKKEVLNTNLWDY